MTADTLKHLVCRLIWIGCFGSHFLDANTAFLRKDISVGDGAMPITVGDFNGDGRPDLAFRSWGCRLPSSVIATGPRQRCPTGTVGGVITVLLNTGGGNFAPPVDTVIDLDVPFDTYPYSFAVDLNGDGKLDLLGTSLGTTPGVRSTFFLPGRGNGAFLQPREIQPSHIVATGACPGGDGTVVDLDGDGRADLVRIGTGFRGANPINVICTIDGVRVPVEYAGPQETPGLDQINIRLTPEVRGQPPIPFGIVTISFDGVPANGAWLQFR